MNNTTHTEASAVQVTRNFTRERDRILKADWTPNYCKDLVKVLDSKDVVDVLGVLEFIQDLFSVKLEEVKILNGMMRKESAK
jgi:hypothetical protein